MLNKATIYLLKNTNDNVLKRHRVIGSEYPTDRQLSALAWLSPVAQRNQIEFPAENVARSKVSLKHQIK